MEIFVQKEMTEKVVKVSMDRYNLYIINKNLAPQEKLELINKLKGDEEWHISEEIAQEIG